MDLNLIAVTVVAVIVSAAINRRKTVQGVRTGWRMLMKLLPEFLMLLVFVSVLLTLVSQETLAAVLGRQAGSLGVIAAACIGSVALIPGPIAYPLAGMLAESGVPLTVLAVFITTLMMVGILTFPVEKAYLGRRLAVLRNVLCLVGALVIGVLVGSLL
jgi:uncharacterized membrane protein YraQ (UPF0718 family)